MADGAEPREIDGEGAVRALAPDDALTSSDGRRSVRGVWRVVGAGAGSVALAAGFMAGSVASVPWSDVRQHPAFTAPVVAEPLELGVVGAASATGPRSVDEVLGVIEQAELTALEDGRELGPEVQQAAAELGALLTTYVAQQQAQAVPGRGDAELPEAVAPAPEEIPPAGPPVPAADELVAPDGLGPSGEPAEESLRPPAEAAPAPTPSYSPAPSAGPEDQKTATDEQTGTDDGVVVEEVSAAQDPAGVTPSDPPAVVSDLEPLPEEVGELGGLGLQLPTWESLVAGDGTFQVRDVWQDASDASGAASVAEVADEGLALGTAAGEHSHDHESVTFDDIVVAATQLASLLDPVAASVVVDVRPAVTRLPDGTFVSDDGVAVTANGLPLGGSLSASLRAVVDRHAGSTAGFGNGRIPTSVLCDVESAPGHLLRCDAAEQFAALNAEYRARFGVDIPVTDSYRSYESQVAVRAAKPHLAAVPGTSNHGWGLALDLSSPISGGYSAEYVWMRVHAPDYGWDNPTWARPNGSKPEPWHFEFFAAGPIPDRASSHHDVTTAGGAGGGSKSSGSSGPAVRDTGSNGSGSSDKSPTKDGGSTSRTSSETKGSGARSEQPSSPKSSSSPSPSAKPKPSSSPSPSSEPEPSSSPSPSAKPSPSPKPEPSSSPSPDPEPEPSSSPKPKPSSSPSPDPEPEPSSSPSPTATAGTDGSSGGDTSGTDSGPSDDSEHAQREEDLLGSRTEGSSDETDAVLADGEEPDDGPSADEPTSSPEGDDAATDGSDGAP